MLCLVENETKVLKTGGIHSVKNSKHPSLPSCLIISRIHFCSPSSPSEISAKLRKLYKKNLLTLVLSVEISFSSLTIFATNPYFL